MAVRVTQGDGTASVASELIGSNQYQQIKVVGGEIGSTSVLGVNPDRSINASIIGIPKVEIVSSVAVSVTPAANQSVSGTVGSSIIGIVPVQLSNASIITVVQGSVAVTVTPVANQSVSGTVGASIIGLPPVNVTNTNLNVSGSVAAWLQSTNASVITVGSPVANQSVSGTVGASVIGIVPVQTSNSSVISYIQNSVAAVIVGGSIAASFTPPANQSVSGTVGASVIGLVPVALTSSNASIITVGTAAANQSVSGTVGASVIGWVPTQPSNTSTIGVMQGSVAVAIVSGSIATATSPSSVMLLNGANTIGSVTALQGTNPWVVVGSVYGNISGSVAAFQAGIQIASLVSITPSSVLVGASIFGQVPATLIAASIPPTSSILVGVTANTNGSVVTTTGYSQALMQITSGPGASITAAINFEGSMDGTQYVPIQGYNIATGAISSVTTTESDWAFNVAGIQNIRARVSNWSIGSITARVNTSPLDARPFSQFIVGTPSVNAVQSGTWSTSVMTNVITSIATAGQVMGSVAALQATNPWIVVSSIAGGIFPVSGSVAATITNTNVNVSGSVVAFVQGNSSVITYVQNSSILAVPVGSVITVLQAPSIVGSYAEDAAHTTGDKGLFALNVRNDTLASVSSADGDYTQMTVGPAGEAITVNAPLTKWVSGTASMLGGVPLTTSVTVIAAQGASIFTYITGVQVANLGSASVLVSFGGGTSSLIAYTIAPAGGGSNIYFQNGIKTNANSAFSASVSGAASIYVSAQGFISKT